MSKKNVEVKRTMLREYRKKLNNELNDFCRKNNICCRCKNPEKEPLKDNTLCFDCKGYYKTYAQKVRKPSKVVVKAKQPKKVAKKGKK